MLTTKMTWAGGLKFQGTGSFGTKITTDAGISAGGSAEGYKPTELLLYGIAGCTGIDVVRIMQKQRQELTSLEIELTAENSDDYPKPFHTIDIKFIAKGKNIDPKKLKRAIELSEEKYCVVSQTVKQETEVNTSFEIVAEV